MKLMSNFYAYFQRFDSRNWNQLQTSVQEAQLHDTVFGIEDCSLRNEFILKSMVLFGVKQ
jgi:hypothetical protein